MYIRMPPSNITLLRFGLDSFIYLHGINRIEMIKANPGLSQILKLSAMVKGMTLAEE